MAGRKGVKRVKDITPKLLRARAASIKKLHTALMRAAVTMEANSIPALPVDGYQAMQKAILDIGHFHEKWDGAYKKYLRLKAAEEDE